MIPTIRMYKYPDNDRPSDGSEFNAHIEGLPFGGDGRTEAEAVHSLARGLGSALFGHARTIDRLREQMREAGLAEREYAPSYAPQPCPAPQQEPQ